MNINALPIPAAAQEQLANSIANYQRHARLMLSVDTINGSVAWCTAHQVEPAPGGRVLAEDEIIARAAQAFAILEQHGITPIVCAYTVDDIDPAKPVRKHQLATHLRIGEQEASVLRIAQPRMLFHATATGQQLLLAEFETINAKPQEKKAAAYAQRVRYAQKYQGIVDAKRAADGEVRAALVQLGIDPDNKLADPTLSILNTDHPNMVKRCTYVRSGRIILVTERIVGGPDHIVGPIGERDQA